MDASHQRRICEDFQLGTPLSLEENHEGVVNRNFVLTTDAGTYFVKSLREKLEVPYIAAVEAHMHATGIPAVCMLESARGDTHVQYDGEVYTVYPFVPSDRSHAHASDDFRAMGAMLGNIHRAGSDIMPGSLRAKAFKEKDIERTVARLNEYRDLIRSKESPDETDRLFGTYIDMKLDLIPRLAPVPFENDVLGHGDYHAGNLLIREDRVIAGVCDWEKAELLPRTYELARSIQYICFGDAQYSETESLGYAAAFLEAYGSVFPVAAEDIRNGFALWLRKMACSFWIEDRYYGNGDPRSNKYIAHEMRHITHPWYERLAELV